MNWRDRIVSDREVLLGKPTVRGTRISVEFILERMANGWSEQDLLTSYPHLSMDDLKAVFAYLNDCVKDGLMIEPRSKAA
jgi:uncharacterized protein (DUF433 family)